MMRATNLKPKAALLLRTMSSALLMNAGAALAPGASSSQASVARARPRRLCSPGTSVVRRRRSPRRSSQPGNASRLHPS
jgi:hypothetical protein